MWIVQGIDNHCLDHCLHIGTHHHRYQRTLRVASSYDYRDARVKRGVHMASHCVSNSLNSFYCAPNIATVHVTHTVVTQVQCLLVLFKYCCCCFATQYTCIHDAYKACPTMLLAPV